MKIGAKKNIVAVVVDMDGGVVSRHTTRRAAETAIEREKSAFRRSAYSHGGAYLPRSIISIVDGIGHAERCGQHSTSWQDA